MSKQGRQRRMHGMKARAEVVHAFYAGRARGFAFRVAELRAIVYRKEAEGLKITQHYNTFRCSPMGQLAGCATVDCAYCTHDRQLWCGRYTALRAHVDNQDWLPIRFPALASLARLAGDTARITKILDTYLHTTLEQGRTSRARHIEATVLRVVEAFEHEEPSCFTVENANAV